MCEWLLAPGSVCLTYSPTHLLTYLPTYLLTQGSSHVRMAARSGVSASYLLTYLPTYLLTYLPTNPGLLACANGCSLRGQCVEGECECEAGWGGADCTERVSK